MISERTRRWRRWRQAPPSCVLFAALALLAVACARRETEPAPLSADGPIHLEEHREAARIEGSAIPQDLPQAVEWRFGGTSPGDWRPAVSLRPGSSPTRLTPVEGALRISLTEADRRRRGLQGGVYVDLPGWNRQDWAFLAVRARASGDAGRLTAWFNRRETPGDTVFEYEPFLMRGESVDVIGDGAVHTYLLRADWIDVSQDAEGPWTRLGLTVDAPQPVDFDLLSVSLVPKEARFAEEAAGVTTEPRREVYRRTLAVHAPAKLEYRVRVPEKGRLDVGLGVLRKDAPVRFQVAVEEGGVPAAVLDETYAHPEEWGQRSVDLARWAGRVVRLSLRAESARPGTVALWASPTVSGARATRRPNVILYVIDAGGAEYMSAYGYNRRTTPHLERLAAEGALFERAYSNSTWSKPSTTSFMTSLQHSVLGGYGEPSEPLPVGATTMAEHLHRAGYQTGVFTSNTWCGTMSGLERGVDELRETVPGSNSDSSRKLQEDFWRWREGSPGEPYWVHFQTTDVHWPWEPVAPVAGLFLSPAGRQAFTAMERRLGESSGFTGRSWGLRSSAQVFEKAGIDRKAYFDGVRSAYDEALAHNDLQLGRLVERLKANGEWEHTLLIVTADHGDWPGLGLFDDWNPYSRVPYLNPYLSHVPLVVVWPERIAPGQRFRQPVSLLDLLPTVLDLTGRPKPGSLQGQSLAPLLLGREGWEPRPVFLDEFTVDRKTKALSGAIEVIDGRWGASLAIGADSEPRLLLYDLWNDPYCLRSVHAERPALVKRYTELLDRQFRDHRRRSKAFRPAAPGALGSQQLETLKSLGYIQ